MVGLNGAKTKVDSFYLQTSSFTEMSSGHDTDGIV